MSRPVLGAFSSVQAVSCICAITDGLLQALAEEEGEQGEDARGGGRGRGRGRQDPRGRQGRGRDADDIPEDLYVARTYWAFLAGDLQPRQSGRIRCGVGWVWCWWR